MEWQTTTWQDVAQALRDCGVSNATDAIRQAKQNELSEEMVMSIVRYFRTNRVNDGPNILYRRIIQSWPGRSLSDAWPKEQVAERTAGDYEREEDARAKENEQRRAEYRADMRRIESQRADHKRLLSLFGDELGGLSDPEFWALAGVGQPGMFHRRSDMQWELAAMQSLERSRA